MGLFSSDNTRHVRRLQRIANRVMLLEDTYKAKTDDELRAMTAEFKEAIKNGKTVDQILPDAFATVREAADRVLNQRAFYVQVLGGIALHQGRIAEMKTGEGKTLTSIFPVYLNALLGKGVHVVEVNEYLAKRNQEWMGKVHRFLGLTVGYSRGQDDGKEKKAAYDCDITYVTSSELGFDYLRDNTAHDKRERVQRGQYMAIVDEADSILIDESRTPLIMSSRTQDNSKQYQICDKFVRTLHEDDYEIDLKERAVRLMESGIEKAERAFSIDNISGAENMELNHFINNALKAHLIFSEGGDYIVSKDKEIIIVDQNTGRQMQGRRYSDGLHQAIEAKEGVPIRNEDKTVATITIQNLFKLYSKLSGMTGTAKTEEQEFIKIYGVDVVCIPTNKDVIREDAADVVFTKLEKKMQAILEDVEYRYGRGQPVLIGTTTIEKSEDIAKMLKMKKIPHNVLNAKHHEREADIVAQAGRLAQVTIATNMAGRGTDILLGGNPEYLATQQLKKEEYDDEQVYNATSYQETDNPEIHKLRDHYKQLFIRYKEQTDKEKEKVIDLGGLHIIGTERHDSRRIDNQLRGRSGRQGDPGSTIFYISCEDEIIKRFGKDVIGGALRLFRMDDIQSRMLTRMFERVQKRVEGYYFDARRYTFEYDNVLNGQRELIYKERNQLLDGADVHKQILNMFPEVVQKIVSEAIDTSANHTEWDLAKANEVLGSRLFGKKVEYLDKENTDNADYTEIEQMVYDAVIEQYEAKVKKITDDGFDFAGLERNVLLSVVDNKWMDHIDAMVQLRNGIGLRGYGQQNPLNEYRREAIDMFNLMVEAINEHAVLFLFKIQIEKQARPMPVRVHAKPVSDASAKGIAPTTDPLSTSKTPVATASATGSYTNTGKEVGRNEPCPCGSGKKYKNCCGQ
ncbi:MAG: preprotein translocase subunit SecA [Christensenellaceae bacterium]|jgi:preprotein translocase subunit SecA|nr:preprotein translocase subunit SecA [Christensenellaceae bacterium]